MKRMLIISYSNLDTDPRVRRQILLFSKEFAVTTVGLKPSLIEGVEHVNIKVPYIGVLTSSFLLMFGSFEDKYWRYFGFDSVREHLRQELYDVIIANDVEALPIAFDVKKNAKILWDAHEYSPRQYENKLKWRLFKQPLVKQICKEYIPKVDARVTVSQGIADEYLHQYGKKFTVITNAGTYIGLDPSETQSGKIRMVHHGGASSSRKIERMIKLMGMLDERFSLDLILMKMKNRDRYYDKLVKLTKRFSNVNILPPVPFIEISRHLNHWDIGLYILPPTNFNNKYALPNKFFEFIQARLMIAIGPSPEMKSIVQKNNIGIVAPDFRARSMAKILNELTEAKIEQFKRNVNIFAKELNEDISRKKYQVIISDLVDC